MLLHSTKGLCLPWKLWVTKGQQCSCSPSGHCQRRAGTLEVNGDTWRVLSWKGLTEVVCSWSQRVIQEGQGYSWDCGQVCGLAAGLHTSSEVWSPPKQMRKNPTGKFRAGFLELLLCIKGWLTKLNASCVVSLNVLFSSCSQSRNEKWMCHQPRCCNDGWTGRWTPHGESGSPA